MERKLNNEISQENLTLNLNKSENVVPKQFVPKQFLFDSPIQFLGVHFLKNEPKGFETEVQACMSLLMKRFQETIGKIPKANEKNLKDSNLFAELPWIQLSIPTSREDRIEIRTNENTNESILNNIFQRITSNEENISDLNSSPIGSQLFDRLTKQSISIPVNQIFLYRGQLNSPVEKCLAFTTIFTHNDVPSETSEPVDKAILQRFMQCFVFYVESPANVSEILDVFRKLHGISSNTVVISAEVKIFEKMVDGKWQNSPREKDSFKLRSNLDKKICVTLQQDLSHFHYPIIKIERCFGMLLSSGRNINSSDMVAIGHSMSSSTVVGTSNSLQQWQVVALWIPSELNLEYLNAETPKDNRVYFTIALDLMIEGIDEPVRFIFEDKAKIVSPPNSMAATATEKFWQNFASKSYKHFQEQFNLVIRQKMPENTPGSTAKYEVVSCLSSTQISHQKQRLFSQLNRTKIDDSKVTSPDDSKASGDWPETPNVEEPEQEDDDEPLLSGTGLVSKEHSQSELKGWNEIIEKWNTNLDVRPKQLSSFVRHGIPQALRPVVWQQLSGSHLVEEKLMQQYKTLVNKSSSYEAIIQRDIYRTFPALERFRESGSTESELLFRICKAYSNYDIEIGYCQGLSFLVAALLLHMPEEQAFCVFVQIMYSYGLRDLYKSGLEELNCKFYQLEMLIDEHMPELYLHFLDLNLETHMYASQWFLTLFTTKFPLNVVFRIIDLFLLDKMDTLLQIALALLKMSKQNLLALDFEGIMKYFRISLPKKYRNDDVALELIRTAIKINVKKSKKYEKEYRAWQESNKNRENKLESLERKNKQFMLSTIRLEQENDELSGDLLAVCNSKIKLRDDLDIVEDKAEKLKSNLLHARSQLADVEEEKRQLQEELKNLKALLREKTDKYERNKKIIEEYKQICQNHQNKLESEKENSNKLIEAICESVEKCESCSKTVGEVVGNWNGPEQTDDPQSLEQNKIADLESELIKTKVALAESENRNQLLVGKLHTTNSELNILRAQTDEAAHQRSNTWLTKTLSTLRDATKVKSSNSISSGISSTLSFNDPTTPTTETGPAEHRHSMSSVSYIGDGKTRRSSSKDIYYE